jgi:hypothetical protein
LPQQKTQNLKMVYPLAEYSDVKGNMNKGDIIHPPNLTLLQAYFAMGTNARTILNDGTIGFDVRQSGTPQDV